MATLEIPQPAEPAQPVVPHALGVSGRSSFNPVENSAMTTAISVRWSISAASCTGSTQSKPARWMTAAAPQPSSR